MNVPKNLATDIVKRMKDIIKQDINYIDTNSTIIATTDPKRVADFHGGAKKVLTSKKEIIIYHDGQYSGSKKGINLPVYFEDRIIGVIGITGEEKEVVRYGKIIKSMTEILIKEAYINEQEIVEREGKRQFIEELLFHSLDKNTLEVRSDLLNIKIDIPRIIVIIKIHRAYEGKILKSHFMYDKIYNFIIGYLNFNKQNIIIQNSQNFILILDKSSFENINNFSHTIYKGIFKNYNVKVCIGIGNMCSDIISIKRSYKEAKRALKSTMKSKKNIIHYSELDIELLIDELPKQKECEFLQKVFDKIEPCKLQKHLGFLIEYIENNGSITKTANNLFIHKNTVQYRLNKIHKLTGYDPRNIKDIAVLHLAIMIYSAKNN